MSDVKRLLISGGTGFIGKALCRYLQARGYSITVLTRNPAKWQSTPAAPGIEYVSSLKELDNQFVWYGVVNLAGEPLSSGRWNARRKAVYRDSRVETTEQIAQWTRQLARPPEVFLSASAIGWYGHWQDEPLDESSTAHDGYTHQLCRDWEAAATEHLAPGCRNCVVRIGIVLGEGEGPLPAMLFPARLGLGGPMGTGSQWWSWIHIEDLIRLFHFLLEKDDAIGPINGTSPNPVTQKAFARALGRQLHRPAFLPLPGFMASLILGEFADEILLNGQRVLPSKSLLAGFTFEFPEIENALSDILG
jgi:uncharacterized protein (TIGR01777 family)